MNCTYDFIIATLSILVTSLIGFQIFNVIRFNREIKKTKKLYKKFEIQFNQIINISEKFKLAENKISDFGFNEAIKKISSIEAIEKMQKSSTKIKYMNLESQYPFFNVSVYEDKEEQLLLIDTYKYNMETEQLFLFDNIDQRWYNITYKKK